MSTSRDLLFSGNLIVVQPMTDRLLAVVEELRCEYQPSLGDLILVLEHVHRFALLGLMNSAEFPPEESAILLRSVVQHFEKGIEMAIANAELVPPVADGNGGAASLEES